MRTGSRRGLRIVGTPRIRTWIAAGEGVAGLLVAALFVWLYLAPNSGGGHNFHHVIGYLIIGCLIGGVALVQGIIVLRHEWTEHKARRNAGPILPLYPKQDGDHWFCGTPLLMQAQQAEALRTAGTQIPDAQQAGAWTPVPPPPPFRAARRRRWPTVVGLAVAGVLLVTAATVGVLAATNTGRTIHCSTAAGAGGCVPIPPSSSASFTPHVVCGQCLPNAACAGPCTPADEALAAQLSGVLTGCRAAQPDKYEAAASVVLACTGASGAPPGEVDSAIALRMTPDQLAQFTATIRSDRCADGAPGHPAQAWNDAAGHASGEVACLTGTTAGTCIYWTYMTPGVFVSACSRTADTRALLAWWTTSDKTLRT